MSKHPNYYRILGVTPFAGQDEIKHAYRALAKRYHPDTMPPDRRDWAREQMARINVAYRVLQDPNQRAEYDWQRGYNPHVRSGPRTPGKVQGTADKTQATTTSALWRRQRARERQRRQLAKRWRIVAVVCGVALVVGIGYTLFFVRSRPGYAISALLNAGFLAVLAISLGAATR
ncbi:MAG: J domain-containing protein [Anaerolineae bacterium]|nr:J domain-containing protein [Anaerolineae bacterium]